MFETSKLLRALIKRMLLEQEERDNKRSEEQEIKDLFQHWIDEYSASYLAYRKKVNPTSDALTWHVTHVSIRELDNFIFISSSFKKRTTMDKTFIVAFNKEDKNIYCTSARAFSLSLAFSPNTLPPNPAYSIECGLLSKVSVDQFKLVMQVTKSNYEQFDALTKRLSKINEKNANV